MGFLVSVKTLTILCSFVNFVIAAHTTNPMDSSVQKRREPFRQMVLDKISKSHADRNFVCSPLLIQNSLAMIRMGADGKTATELDHCLGETTKSAVNSYYTLLAEFEKSPYVTMANKIYIRNGTELKGNFKEIFKKKFFSSAESIRFGQSQEAVNTINKWVESETNYLIKDIVTPNDIDAQTEIVILNAIHFKGDWLRPFFEPHRNLLHLTDETNTVDIPIIKTYGEFYYAVISELNATAVKLPFKNSDLSLLMILPDSITGLADMLKKLRRAKLESFLYGMHDCDVAVIFPEMKFEFTLDLTDTLKDLGLRHMFETADFGKLFKSPSNLAISKVIHKVVIEIDETGTEPFRKDFDRIAYYYGNGSQRGEAFIAGHPFYYAVINNDNVALFEGTMPFI